MKNIWNIWLNIKLGIESKKIIRQNVRVSIEKSYSSKVLSKFIYLIKKNKFITKKKKNINVFLT